MTGPGAASTPGTSGDDRHLVRILIASSIELRDEREALDRLIRAELAARPDLARSFRFECLRWDKDAVPVAGERINQQIDQSLDLDDVDIVIALVWRKIGAGTREEIERALERFGAVGRPALLVVRQRAPCPEGPDERRRWQELDVFCRELVDHDQIVSEVDDGAELVERVRHHLPQLLPRPRHAAEPAKPEVARRSFFAIGAGTLILSLATLVLTRTMSFPSRHVGFWPVLLTLAAAPALGILALGTRWLFGRLLDSFVATWFSPAYRDQDLYRAFDLVVPAQVLPRRARRPLAKSAGSDLWRWGLVALFLLAPIVAQYSAIFDEILLWDLVVGTEVIAVEGPPDGPRSPDGRPCSDGRTGTLVTPVESCYVDWRKGKIWPLGLRNEAVKRKHSFRGQTVYVHAQGKFAIESDLPPDEKYRANLGPEVFPLWQPAIYLVLFAVSAGAQLHGLWRLGRMAKELRPRRAQAYREPHCESPLDRSSIPEPR